MTDENTLRTEGDLAFISALAECAIAHGKTILTRETAVSLLSVVGNLSKALAAQPRDDVPPELDGIIHASMDKDFERKAALAPTTQGTDSPSFCAKHKVIDCVECVTARALTEGAGK